MKKVLFVVLFLLMSVVPVDALDLLMFSSSKCSYCQNFIKEVVPGYDKTKYHKLLPLKIIDIDNPPPQWILNAFKDDALFPIKVTPTFVVWDNREVLRTEGYIGVDEFYQVMDAFIGHFEVPLMQKEPKIEIPKLEGSHGRHNKSFEFKPNNPPEGVINSRDIFKHMYPTAEEALKASKWLGCNGNIHYHDEEAVWMPCVME
jgi:hypothetical protein